MEQGHNGVQYEKTDVKEGAIARAGIALVAVGLLSGVAVLWLFGALLSREVAREPPPPPLAQASGRQPPEPRLQERPASDVDALRAEEREVLSSYGWVNEEKGVVRIPIDEAMRILARRGLPVGTSPPGTSPEGKK